MAFTCCLQHFYSFLSLEDNMQVVIGDLVNHVNCAFTVHLHYHETHDTQKQLQTTSSIHRLL